MAKNENMVTQKLSTSVVVRLRDRFVVWDDTYSKIVERILDNDDIIRETGIGYEDLIALKDLVLKVKGIKAPYTVTKTQRIVKIDGQKYMLIFGVQKIE